MIWQIFWNDYVQIKQDCSYQGEALKVPSAF